LLAVSPLHIYFSSQGIPDVVSLFFLLCGLAALARMRENGAGINIVICFGCSLAAALITKANALYFWVYLLVIAGLFLRDGQTRRRCLLAAAIAPLPLLLLTALIRTKSPTLSFFQEPGVTTPFTLALSKLGDELSLFARFFDIVIIAAIVGGLMLAHEPRSRSRWWVFLIPLATLIVGPYFRVTPKDLLLLLPTLCLFASIALTPTTRVRTLVAIAVIGWCLWQSLSGVPLPIPPRPSSAMARTTAVSARPAGWPSRQATRWLIQHSTDEDAILITAFTFTDPLILDLQKQRKVIPNAGPNWELLREPANRIKYVVFVEDHRAYAPQFAEYADAHFALPADANFPGYAIYDCQKNGRFVAYADAFNSAGAYIQRGVELLGQQQCDPAIEAFETALKVDPASPAAKRNLMLAYLQCDRKEAAAQFGSEILRQEPADPVISANMAILYLESGRIEDGLAQCRRNIERNIAPALSYGVLGQLLEKTGDLEAARDAYEKSLSIEPANDVSRRLLEDVRAKLKVR
jgi:tetratricopeptide (TPR) repeat protein